MYSKKLLWVLLVLAAKLWACPTGKKDSGANGNTHIVRNLPTWGLNTEGAGIQGDGVKADEGGSLVFDKDTRMYHMWLPDLSNGLVSKFDLKTGEELARYHSVIPISCRNGQTPEQKNCSAQPRVNVKINYRPNRTAVDLDGNLWVANDGYGAGARLSSVTKIAAKLKDCVDRNGDGEIRTSRVKEDGSIVVEESDECVLFTTPVCGGSLGANALAISRGAEGSAGDVWVGCYDEQTVYQLDLGNGQIKRGPIPLGMSPSGALVDGKQTLWLTNIGAELSLQGVNTQTGEVLSKNAWGQPVPFKPDIACGRSFGLAVDSQNRVWFAGSAQNHALACFYNPYAAEEGDKWRRCAFPDKSNNLGIAVGADDHVYMPAGGRLSRFRWNEEAGGCEFSPPEGSEGGAELSIGAATGVGFDAEGNPWSIGFNRAARLHLKTGQREFSAHAPSPHLPVYHAFSDFTGHQLRHFTAPRGLYQRTIQGCEQASWKSLSWEASVPENTKLQVYVRVAPSESEWPAAFRYGPLETSPVDLTALSLKGKLMRLEFVLLPSEDRKSAPALHAYEMKWACEG